MLRVAPCLLLVFALACGSSHTNGDASPGDGAPPESGADARADRGTPGDTSCGAPRDCVVVPRSCCGSCGAATRGDAIALNRNRVSDYQARVCDGTTCAGCFMQQDPSLVPTCTDGQCQVVDLHEHEAGECSSGDDCRLRTQACCECGGDTGRGGLIAIRSDANSTYVALVCDDPQPCPECEPMYPPNAQAVCVESHCEVDWM